MDETEIQDEAARREAEWGVGGCASSDGSGSGEEDQNSEQEEEEEDEANFGKVIERDCQLIYTAHDNETPAEVSPLQSHFPAAYFLRCVGADCRQARHRPRLFPGGQQGPRRFEEK